MEMETGNVWEAGDSSNENENVIYHPFLQCCMYVTICHKLIKYAAVTERSQYSDDLVTAGCRSPAVQGDTAGSRGQHGDGGHTGNMKWTSCFNTNFTD